MTDTSTGHPLPEADQFSPVPPLPIVARLAGEMDRTPVFDDATRRRMLHDNALTLFPRLRA